MAVMSEQEFIDSYYGYDKDFDGVAGAQCVDLWKIRNMTVGNPNYNQPIGGDGYAYNIWTRRDALGYSQWFDYINAEDVTRYDWAIWGMNSPSAPVSHVGIIYEDLGNGQALVFGMNQGGSPSQASARVVQMSKAGIIGGFRTKNQENYQPTIQTKHIESTEPYLLGIVLNCYKNIKWRG